MKNLNEERKRMWTSFYGENKDYIDEQFIKYHTNKKDVDESFIKLFETYGKPIWKNHRVEEEKLEQKPLNFEKIKILTSAIELIEAIRSYGHLEAEIYPVSLEKKDPLLWLTL